jgi:hypothetical protein
VPKLKLKPKLRSKAPLQLEVVSVPTLRCGESFDRARVTATAWDRATWKAALASLTHWEVGSQQHQVHPTRRRGLHLEVCKLREFKATRSTVKAARGLERDSRAVRKGHAASVLGTVERPPHRTCRPRSLDAKAAATVTRASAYAHLPYGPHTITFPDPITLSHKRYHASIAFGIRIFFTFAGDGHASHGGGGIVRMRGRATAPGPRLGTEPIRPFSWRERTRDKERDKEIDR